MVERPPPAGPMGALGRILLLQCVLTIEGQTEMSGETNRGTKKLSKILKERNLFAVRLFAQQTVQQTLAATDRFSGVSSSRLGV